MLNELRRLVARLQSAITRGISAAPNPLPGAVPECAFLGSDGLPAAELAQIMPLPGAHVWLPPGCNLLVVRVQHGQDPVVIGGTGTSVAIKAVQAFALTHPTVAAGGLIIADPVVGTCAIVITPTGGDLIGTWSKNGVPLP